MRRDPIRELKTRALLYAILGVLVILLGIKYQLPVCTFFLVIAVLAWFFLNRALAFLLGAGNLDREQMRRFQQAFQQQFERHNVPRQVFWLLFAVAEADGSTEAEERELVRRFLLERFTDPATAADLREWEASRIPPEQLGILATGLARTLSPSERETVFSWCCLVAFADKTFSTEEHVALQTIARAFGFAGHHARRIFHWAKSVHLGGGDPAGDRGYRGESHREQHGAEPPKPRGAVTDRRHALRILGLDESADRNAIKKRHRELVRQFHPDRHQHLGEVAAREAEERFREVQAAYEVLAG